MLTPKQLAFLAKGTDNEKFSKEKPIEVFKKFPKQDPTPQIDGLEFNKENLWKEFIKYYAVENYKRFEITEDSKKNLEPIFKYFLRDPDFVKSDRVIKKIGNSDLVPNLNKGLLVIGGTGNGKTTIMRAFSEVFKRNTVQARECNWKSYRDWNENRFIAESTTAVVMEFEGLNSPEAKKSFYKMYGGFRYFFDDLTREHTASNYGKKEVFTDILSARYNNRALTHITLNYSDLQRSDCEENYSNLEFTLLKIAERYGTHIYDRIFEMYNIIEFQGKSMRK